MRATGVGGPAGRPGAAPFSRRAGASVAALALALVAALALAGSASAAKPVFGIVPQDGALPSTSDLDLMPGAGIGGLRTMLPWGLVEARQGEYDWRQTDAIVRETTNRGIQPLVFLYGTPEWATNVDRRRCDGGGGCAVYPPRTKSTRAAFGAFAAAAAARYGPGGDFWEAPASPPRPASTREPALIEGLAGREACPIPLPLCEPPPPAPVPAPPPPGEPPCGCTEPSPITAWQIWNEQNSPKYFAPKVSVRRYAALLKSAADGIRSIDPKAEIVLGGMWGPRSARKVVTPTNTYLEKLYAIGAADSFDSIAIHPYANDADASIAQLRSARRVLVEAGDRKAGIWVTEIGWAGRGPKSNPYVKGLTGQARVLSRALSAFKRKRRSLKLRGVFWYSWRDIKGGDVICEWCGHAGLRNKKGKPKPAWRAFVRVARS